MIAIDAGVLTPSCFRSKNQQISNVDNNLFFLSMLSAVMSGRDKNENSENRII